MYPVKDSAERGLVFSKYMFCFCFCLFFVCLFVCLFLFLFFLSLFFFLYLGITNKFGPQLLVFCCIASYGAL